MISGNVSRLDDEKCVRELWHFTLSNELTIRFHKYELIRFCVCNLADSETLELWKYPDLNNKSNIEQPAIPPWAIQDAKTLILTKIKLL